MLPYVYTIFMLLNSHFAFSSNWHWWSSVVESHATSLYCQSHKSWKPQINSDGSMMAFYDKFDLIYKKQEHFLPLAITHSNLSMCKIMWCFPSLCDQQIALNFLHFRNWNQVSQKLKLLIQEFLKYCICFYTTAAGGRKEDGRMHKEMHQCQHQHQHQCQHQKEGW